METEANSAHLIGELLLSVALVVEADDAGARGLAPELHDVEEREVVELAHAGVLKALALEDGVLERLRDVHGAT